MNTRTLVHAILMAIGLVPWVGAMLLMTIVVWLSLVGERVLPNAKRQNCWTYALPRWSRGGGYLLIRPSDGVRFLRRFPVPHAIWVKELPAHGIELEVFSPVKRKHASIMPWHTIYYEGKVNTREKPRNAAGDKQ